MDYHVDLSVYWQIIKRRKWKIIIPTGVIILIAAMVAFILPPKYESKATILVEAQSIPEEMVQSTVTSYVEERIQSIRRIVLARQNLSQIIERFDLYPEIRQSSTTQKAIGTMRNHITIEPVQTQVRNSRAGHRGRAIIAFKLSYEGNNPSKAAQVTNILASQFMEENSRLREQEAETTADFLQTQLTQLEKKLDQVEQKIADFKDKHLYTLPSMTQLNMNQQQRIQDLIDSKRNQIQKLKDRKIYLEGQLLTLEPNKYLSSQNRVNSPEEHLKQLRNQYLSAKASHSPSHPDVIRLKKQVQALEQEVKIKDNLNQIGQKLEQKKSELASLRKKFSDKYPDVVKLKKEVQELRNQYQKMMKNRETLSDVEQKPENPSYIELQTRIETTAMELESARKEIKDLQEKYQMYQNRLEKSPMVEQKYNALQREYSSLQMEYKETKTKLMKAQEAQVLEKKQMSQKLRLIDPPVIPEQPSSPNRLALLLIGGILALGFGVGTGSAYEFLDKSVYDSNQLAGLVKQPVFSEIPYIETIQEKRQNILKKLGFILLFLVSLALVLWAVHLWVTPLEVIWIHFQERLQNML